MGSRSCYRHISRHPGYYQVGVAVSDQNATEIRAGLENALLHDVPTQDAYGRGKPWHSEALSGRLHVKISWNIPEGLVDVKQDWKM